jgi:hypothetical protein
MIGYFLNDCILRNWLIVSDVEESEYFPEVNFRKIKIIARNTIDIFDNYLDDTLSEYRKRLFETGQLQRFHTIDIKIDITYISNSTPMENISDIFYYLNQEIDMDVNQLYYRNRNNDIYFKVSMNMNLSQIKKQIRRKEFKIRCESDNFIKDREIICYSRYGPQKILERKKKMEMRGWRCLNGVCKNPWCIFSEDEAFEKYNALHNFSISQIEENILLRRKDELLLDRSANVNMKEMREEVFVRRWQSKRIGDKKRERTRRRGKDFAQ